jgi:cathepsin F
MCSSLLKKYNNFNNYILVKLIYISYFIIQIKMKFFTKVIIAIAAIIAVAAFEPNHEKESYIFSKFQAFLKEHGKSYSTIEEYSARFKVFKANYERIESFSVRPGVKHSVGVTKFMDLTKQEFRNTYLNLKVSLLDQLKAKSGKFQAKSLANPTAFDWREQGAVGPVKDQGQCGSCWAFSTVANLEGLYQIKNKKSVVLSEQSLVDCDKVDNGCNGGLMENSLAFVRDNGIALSTAYPYHGRDQRCQSYTSAMKVSGFTFAPSEDEEEIKSFLVQTGPLSIAVNAEPFQFYSGGVLDADEYECDPQSLNHGVALVGYGVENGTEYWVVRNSWGKNWGENGYIRLALGKGVCGVNTYVISGDF